jgi:hypothetical protein
VKILRAVLLAVLVAPALVVVGATQALACSCIPPEPDKVAVKDADAVFSGTVADIEDGVDIGFDNVTWTFAVDKVYKGDEVSETQDVTSQTQSAACGLIFKEEKRYALFAYENKGKLVTNLCMNTRPLADGKDLSLEPIATFDNMGDGEGRVELEPEQSGGWDPITVGTVGLVAVGALVAIGFLIARRRKT